MESLDPVWLFGGIALVTGTLIGFLAYRLFNPASVGIDKLKAELEQARADMKDYKANVNTHFNKTSDLVNELTQDYVKVYRHLAEGAQTLSDTREFTQVLEQPQGQVLISVAAQTDAPTVTDPTPQADATDAAATPAAEDPLTAPSDYAPASESDTFVDEAADAAVEKVDDAGQVTDKEEAAETTLEENNTANAADADEQASANQAESDSNKKT